MIEFLLNKERRTVTDIWPNTSLLEYLRGELGLCGTKEGCASGDCGACTVVVSQPNGKGLSYKVVNSCITMLPTIHGKQVITVEHLADGEQLHPVQQAMVDNHGSQCGFCTPGIVMSLFSLYQNNADPKRQDIVHSLSGNLCRCTGYKSIIAAAEHMRSTEMPDKFAGSAKESIAVLNDIAGKSSAKLNVDGQHYYAPASLMELADVYEKNVDARLLAGGTDLMLEITQLQKEISPVICVQNVPELRTIEDEDDYLVIGAAAPISSWLSSASSYYPDFGKVLERFGSPQIRNVGTLGGNLGTASPIGDSLPALLALDAVVVLRKGGHQRELPVLNFLIGYRKTALEPGEFIEAVRIPKPTESRMFFMRKVSKRPEDDISAVCAAFSIGIQYDRINYARLAFGGVAATPYRAVVCEQSLIGATWSPATIETACTALAGDLQPISDIRASAEYRLTIAQNLLRKCFLESQVPDRLRVIESMSKRSRSEKSRPSEIRGSTSESIPHESGPKHVSGSAIFVDDMPLLQDQLFAYIGCSEKPCARIKTIDLDAVRRADGVVAVLTAEDIPGDPFVGPIIHDEPLLAQDRVEFVGQPVFVVAATTYNRARKAATLAKIGYAEETPVLTIEDALRTDSKIFPDKVIERGDAAAAIKRAPRQLSGQRYLKGQEHFYLEGQISRAVPTEDGGVVIYPSSQHANEIQSLTAKILDIPMNRVTVEVRRVGGAFGGKESPATPFACLSALLAYKLQRPVSLRPSRSDDMTMTGKRHDMRTSYAVGFDETGRILGADVTLSARCGYSADLSPAVVERAMLSMDNAYFIENFRITGQFCKTNTPSSTAFRGFGTPQAMVTIEGMLDDIACELGMDRLEVREVNFYDDKKRNTTHYHQEVEHNILPSILEDLRVDAEFHERCNAVDSFNAENDWCKKGIALTPLKYGVGYPILFMNQAGALIHIYTDGSIHLSHGGVEMGQGVLTKISQIVAEEFQVDVKRIIVSSMRTDKVANATVSSASFTTDLNGMAALNAARAIKNRLIDFASENFSVSRKSVEFRNNKVIAGGTTLTFAELIQAAYFNRVSLSSTGFFKTPKVHFDMDAAKGRPYFYYVFGAAISEVIIDVLTGEYKVERVDILHDVGRSLNPGIDLGQIEGGFVQGMGWLTSEEIDWDTSGRFLSNSPSTYKIPTAGDIPSVFNARIMTDGYNPEDTPFHSKAVGEPPLCLSISVWAALRHAISSVVEHATLPRLDVPATPERVLFAIEEVRKRNESHAASETEEEAKRLAEA